MRRLREWEEARKGGGGGGAAGVGWSGGSCALGGGERVEGKPKGSTGTFGGLELLVERDGVLEAQVEVKDAEDRLLVFRDRRQACQELDVCL